MDLKQFLQVMRRRWRSVVVILIVAIASAGALAFVQTPQYESKSTVFLSVDVRDTTDAYAAQLFISDRAASYADIAQSSQLAERVIEVLDLDETPESLASRISATVLEGTVLIEITVLDEDPQQARTIADVVTQQFTDYITELETPAGTTGASQIKADVTDEASLNNTQVAPQVALYLVTAGMIGLLLGVATALARDLLDRTITTADHVADLTDAPVLASIGFDSEIKKAPLLTDLGGFAARTEAFRLLRTNLQFIDLDHQAKVLVVTSAVPGEGKTMTSTNLAVALSQTGRKVLIVDADLRRPRVASTLGVDPAVGLTTALVGKTELYEAIQVHEPSGLHVLASGAKPPNPTEILQARVTQDLFRRLRQSYDMVIIDAPPLLPVADASVLATVADGMILVIRHAKTTRDQVNEALTRVNQVGGRMFGIVVNMVAKRAVGSYYYYYYEETSPVSAKAQQKAEAKGSRRAKVPDSE